MRQMPRRSHRAAVLGFAVALIGALALGWGLPRTTTSSVARSVTGHAVRVAETASDAIVVVAAPEAVAPQSQGAPHERAQDLFGAATVTVALLLFVAQRRRLACILSGPLHLAVVAHGGRAPPV